MPTTTKPSKTIRVPRHTIEALIARYENKAADFDSESVRHMVYKTMVDDLCYLRDHRALRPRGSR